jgi:hypothetical protein
MSWIQMFAYAKGKYDFSPITIHGPYIDTNRDTLISQAFRLEPDYILFLDDDQTYPPDTPEILMKHIDMGVEQHGANYHVDIVGGVTPRKVTHTPMLWDYEDGEVKFWDSLNGQTGLTKVAGMGMGGVMLRPWVFQRLESPYFKIHDKPTYRLHGEDMAFYLKCGEVGIDIWADLDLQYGHMVMNEARIGA